MQIDSTKKFVLFGVKSHIGPPFLEDFLGFLNHTVFRYGEGGLNEYQVAEMNVNEYLFNLGKLMNYFHTLEFALRAYLSNVTINKGDFDYSKVQRGNTLPENAFTNYDSLAQLIDKYNSCLENHPEMRVDKGLVDIRDALAHGRVFSQTNKLPLKLIKFSKPDKGFVQVTFAEILDENWFLEKANRIYNDIEKILQANKKVQ